jgi:hypothetical protein
LIGAIESLRLWLVRCAAFSAWNKLLPVPGACMLVKREAVCSVGGFRAGTTELFLDLHAAAAPTGSPWRIAFVAAPVSFRPAAATWDDLRRQAKSDQRQLAAALRDLGSGAGREFFGLFCSADCARCWKPPPMCWLPPAGLRDWSSRHWRRWCW